MEREASSSLGTSSSVPSPSTGGRRRAHSDSAEVSARAGGDPAVSGSHSAGEPGTGDEAKENRGLTGWPRGGGMTMHSGSKQGVTGDREMTRGRPRASTMGQLSRPALPPRPPSLSSPRPALRPLLTLKLPGRYPTKDPAPGGRIQLRRGKSFPSLLSGMGCPLPGTPEVELEELMWSPSSPEKRQRAVSSEGGLPRALIALTALFSGSLLSVYLLLLTLPPSPLPRTLTQLLPLITSLKTYSSTSRLASLHLWLVVNVAYLWLNVWSVPGGALINVLMGALWGAGWGTLFACLGSAGGAMGGYWLGLQGKALFERYLPKPLSTLRHALARPGDLFRTLLLLRLVPLVPSFLFNPLTGALSLPTRVVFVAQLLGSFPINFCTVEVGALLTALNGKELGREELWNGAIWRRVGLITLVGALPLVFRRRLGSLLASPFLRRLSPNATLSARPFVPPTAPARATHAAQNKQLSSRLWRRSWNDGLGSGFRYLPEEPSSVSVELGRFDLDYSVDEESEEEGSD